MRLWYNEPAPDSDLGWVNRSIPMGNGYMGVNLFGGTSKERIQITENSLYDWGNDRGLRRRGLNNFVEVYIDFGHNNVKDYMQDLDLNQGVSHVKYEQDGVVYTRKYFTSYPDKVMAILHSSMLMETMAGLAHSGVVPMRCPENQRLRVLEPGDGLG